MVIIDGLGDMKSDEGVKSFIYKGGRGLAMQLHLKCFCASDKEVVKHIGIITCPHLDYFSFDPYHPS